MSDFFESDIIRNELEDIHKLQKEVYVNVLEFPNMSREERLENVEKLSKLLEKQQVMFTRLSLSDDPEAIKLKNTVQQSIPLMGFPVGTDMNILFEGMKQSINKLKENVDIDFI